MNVDAPLVIRADVRTLGPALSLQRDGTLWRPPAPARGMPIQMFVPSMRAGAILPCGRRMVGIDTDGKACFTDDGVAVLCPARPGPWRRVLPCGYGATWIHEDGTAEACLWHPRPSCHAVDAAAPGHRTCGDVAAGPSCLVVLRADRSLGFLQLDAPDRDHLDRPGPVARLVTRLGRARAIAGNGEIVAIVDEHGHPHFAAAGSRDLALEVPRGLPPLARLALAASPSIAALDCGGLACRWGEGSRSLIRGTSVPRVAALDETGRAHDWGEGSLGRDGLPGPMQESGFREVFVGTDWLALLDRRGRAYAVGSGMEAWARVDPLHDFLCLAKAEQSHVGETRPAAESGSIEGKP